MGSLYICSSKQDIIIQSKREAKAKVRFLKKGSETKRHPTIRATELMKPRAEPEEKTNQAMGTMEEKAQQAKEKTYQTGRAARYKAEGEAESTKDWKRAQAAREEAQSGKKGTTGGILEKTGEKVKSMAEGAADAVKSTFGMAQHDDDVDKLNGPPPPPTGGDNL